MVSKQDIAIFSGIFLLAVAVVVGVGGLSLDGTQEISGCSIPIVSGFISQCNSGVDPNDPVTRYNLETTIPISATDVNAVFSRKDFDYETEKRTLIPSLSTTSPSQNLAFGANQVSVGFQLENEDGETIADANRFIGEIQALSSEKVSFGVNNLEQGTYEVNYELSYRRDFELTEGKEITKTLTKTIRVPKNIG